MKIVDLSEFYSERGGGVRSHLTAKSHVLCQLGHEHVVMAPGPRDLTTIASANDGLPCSRIIRIGGPSLPYDPTYHLLGRLDRVRKHLLAEAPDVLEVHSPYLAMLAALALGRKAARLRSFFWHADFIDTYFQVMLERHLSRGVSTLALSPLWGALIRALQRFDIVCVAGRGQADKLRLRGLRNVVHVPFGVDKETFHPRPADPLLRRRLLAGAPEDSTLLIGVGRLSVEKRWDIALDALELVTRSGGKVALALYGDGPERTSLELRARGMPVYFAGFESDRTALATAYASADCLVHTCPFETFGLGVSEAMATGLPVIVPSEGGASEQVFPGSSTIYPSLSAEALASAIREFLPSLAQGSVHAAARARADSVPSVRDHFTLALAAYERGLGSSEVRE